MSATVCGGCGYEFPKRDKEKEMPEEIKVIEFKSRRGATIKTDRNGGKWKF